MDKKKTAFIIIDSGFSAESLARADTVIGIADVSAGKFTEGAPVVSRSQLAAFAGDRLPKGGLHGSIVLDRLLDCVGDAPLVLVTAWDVDGRCVRTRWHNHEIVRQGWTEAYVWAVELCRRAGYNSVANLSFGGFRHAADGSGWEAHRLGMQSGSGKSGHIVVAAAGAGTGRAERASCDVLPGSARTINAVQDGDSTYTFWAPRTEESWVLTVATAGGVLFRKRSQDIPVNFWNNRRQETFTVPGGRPVSVTVSRADGTCGPDQDCQLHFDCFVVEGDAVFIDHVDANVVAEPACFPGVLSVGLRCGKYSPDQTKPHGKPDILLRGEGPISFRLPEVVAAVGRALESDPTLDVDDVRQLLGKYPNLSLLGN